MLLVGLAAPVAALQAGVTNYTYDELGRLVRVSDTRNGNRDYAYDPAGNRRQVTVGASRVGAILVEPLTDAADGVYSASIETPEVVSPAVDGDLDSTGVPAPPVAATAVDDGISNTEPL